MRNDISSGGVSLFFPRSRTSTSANRTGTWSFFRPAYRERTAPCSVACPCGEDIPRIEMLASRGLIEEAWRTILEENPLPGTCGRVCFHPCEARCNRGEFDEPVSVNALERFLDDSMASSAGTRVVATSTPAAASPQPEAASLPAMAARKIAILGAGPAGLSAAWFLKKLGFAPTLFDPARKPGGVLRNGIPRYRLPRDVLDREIGRILDAGIGFAGGRTLTPEEAGMLGFSAVFISTGHGKSLSLAVPGAELAEDGLRFLEQTGREEPDSPEAAEAGTMDAFSGKSVAVIGGGNTAIDVARSLARRGARVTIVYRRRRGDMPAFVPEVERAVAEGVHVEELLAPARIGRGEGVKGLRLVATPMRAGAPDAKGRPSVSPSGEAARSFEFDRIFLAVGAEAAEPWMLPPAGAITSSAKHCVFSFDGEGVPVIYGGDLVNESESVADAIASGKEAAIALDVLFSTGREGIEAAIHRSRVGDGMALSMERYLRGPRFYRTSSVVSPDEIGLDYFDRSRAKRGQSLDPKRALGSFDEVEGPLDAGVALDQAERCFNCGICNDCDNCRTFCPEAAVSAARATGQALADESGPDRTVDPQYCKGCGICIEECPRGAMEIEELES